MTARLVGQLVLSLAAVLALMWLAAKVMKGAGGARSAVNLDIVARRQLSRGASVSVVRVGERAIVLGVTESSVTMLSEATLAEFEATESAPRRGAGRAERVRATDITSILSPGAETGDAPEAQTVLAARATGGGPLEGSILSPDTWRRTVDALRERTARRG